MSSALVLDAQAPRFARQERQEREQAPAPRAADREVGGRAEEPRPDRAGLADVGAHAAHEGVLHQLGRRLPVVGQLREVTQQLGGMRLVQPFPVQAHGVPEPEGRRKPLHFLPYL